VVGAVVSVEASRLARNGRDWHTLLEFCALVGSLILDEDGVYDPRSPNDRLLLGMKGTFSEMELSLLRQRSQEALKLKAARGELHTMVAIGYVRGPGDRIEMDPDLRIREAIALVFRKFAELHSVRQVLLWLQQEALPLPRLQHGPDVRTVVWTLPVYASVRHVLTNPVYAGAYAFGRSETRVCIEEGRKKVRRERLRTHERQGEAALTKIFRFNVELPSILDNARQGGYNAARHPSVRDPAFEPTRDRPTTRCSVRRGALPDPDGSPSLPGCAGQDRPHPVVCRHLERAVAGAAEFLCGGLEVRGA
jgi:hypothetical protein